MTEVGVSLSDAVERHVRPGDAVHVMLGHSRWTAAARETARQFWGTDAGFTLIMTSLGALGALFFRGGMLRKVVTAYSGNSFPSYAPNPIFKRGLRVRRGGPRALVDPHPRPAARGGGPGPSGHGDRLGGRVGPRRQSRLHHGRLPLRPGRPAGPAGSRRRPLSTPRWPMPGATWSSPNRCSRGPGGRGRPGGGWWPPSRGSWTTSPDWATGCGSPPTGCWRWSRRPSAPTPVAATRRAFRWPGTARTSPSGSTPPPPPGRLRCLGPAEPARPAGPRRLPRAARGRPPARPPPAVGPRLVAS